MRPDESNHEVNSIFNVNYSINYWLTHGGDKSKMVMGMPFYGRSWTIKGDKINKNIGDAAFDMSPPGYISGESGVYGYNEICEIMKNQSTTWTMRYDDYYKAPYAYNNTIWVGYDDVKSIACKVSFLKQMGLSGGMIWALETDDFMGRCGARYPLLNKVNNMLNGAEKSSFECEIGESPDKPSVVDTNTNTNTDGDNPGTFKCLHQGYAAHPSDMHKYVFCENAAGKWYIHIMDCPLGTRWHQPLLNCIFDTK